MEENTEIKEVESTGIPKGDLLTKYLQILIGLIIFFSGIVVSLGGYIYINDQNDDDQKWEEAKERWDQHIVLHEKHLELIGNLKVENESIKKYILFRDDIDIDKLSDQALWDDFLKRMKEESSIRSVRMKEIIDTISEEIKMQEEQRLFCIYSYKRFNCIIKHKEYEF